MKVPNLIDSTEEEAIKTLNEKKIKYHINKRISFNHKKGIVFNTYPKYEEDIKKSEILEVDVSIVSLLPILIIAIGSLGLLIGLSSFINGTFINVAPQIALKYNGWVSENTVYVSKDAKVPGKLDYYEVCVNKERNVETCDWKKTSTKNVKISETGVWYVYFKAISKTGKEGKISKPVIVYIDNNAVDVSDIDVEPKDDHIEIDINPKDINKNGIKYYYRINDGDLIEFDGDQNKLNVYFESLDRNHDNKITIVIIDEAGNEEKMDITVPKEIINDDNNNSEEIIMPSIDLNDVPSTIDFGEEYSLPSHYDFGGGLDGKVYCINNNSSFVTSTLDLGMGQNMLVCTVVNEQNNSVVVNKLISVNIPDGDDEEFAGWIRMNLYYPEDSTDWEWRLGNENAIRDGLQDTGWQPYTGPILVKIEDVENVYIRYKLNDQLITVSPSGKLVVDIIPDSFEVKNNETTKVNIVCDSKAETCEYRIDGGDWQNYTNAFEVPADTLIEARATRNVAVYDNDGNKIGTNPSTTYDTVWISEYVEAVQKFVGKENSKVSFDSMPNIGSNPIVTTIRPISPKRDAISAVPSYLEGPVITSNPNNSVKTLKDVITITTKEEASAIYYQINGNSKILYTTPFEISDNVLISAYYIRKSDGKTSDVSRYYVRNTYDEGLPYVRIDVNPSEYLSETVKEATVTISASNYNTLEYSLDGNLYFPYTSPIKVTSSTTVYGRAKNNVGETIELVTIRTQKIVTKDKLYVEILADPASSRTPIDKTRITIEYDEKATDKYYKLGYYGELKTYTGPFDVSSNDTVYAYAINSNGYGEAKYNINFLTTGVAAPEIEITPKTLTEMVMVNIKCANDAVNCKYKINNGNYIDYTLPFEITSNCTITAYNENEFGQSNTSKTNINNITYIPKYTQVEKDEYFILKVNYPSSSNEAGREYKWTSNGTWKHYDATKGILLIKKKYVQKYQDLLRNSDGLKVIDDNGKQVLYTDHYYFLDQDLSNIDENLFMRWNSGTPNLATFIKDTEDWATSVNVGINYDKSSVKKMYRMVDDTGYDTGWKDYKGAIKVTDAGTTIYAKSMNSAEIWSDVASTTINNIDKDLPIITNFTVSSKGSSKITVTAIATDATTSVTKYYFSLDKEDWKISNTNSYTFKGLTTNTEYTIYVKVKDQVDHESAIMEINTKTSEIGEITYSSTPSANTWSTNKQITINYPSDIYDDYEYQYSLDLGETWLKYTNSLMFEENNQIIIARVVDGENIKTASTYTTGMIDKTMPTISLDGIPSEIESGAEYNLPMSYTDGPSGSARACSINGISYNNASELPAGEYTINCTITTGAGNTASVSKEIKVTNATIKGDSLLDIINNKINKSGYYDLRILDTNEIYSAHVIVLDGNQHITENTKYGDANDCASGTTEDKMAQHMVIVKVNGDLEIDSGVTVGPYYNNTYGGPKGFMLYVTGKLTNNGTIDNSHGAYAYGQDVYLWKNADGTYEYVPAVGGAGGAAVCGETRTGIKGENATDRALGGGGSGSSHGLNNSYCSGAGTAATSYSGGTGGGPSYSNSKGTDGHPYGGAGGNSPNNTISYYYGGGAGNPGGVGEIAGGNGTGGLLIISSDQFENYGKITANGVDGIPSYVGSGASGGGSINIFTNQLTNVNQLGIVTNDKYDEIKGTTDSSGGIGYTLDANKKKTTISGGSSGYVGGSGGKGSVNIGEIRNGQYYDLKEIIEQDKISYTESVTKHGESILSIVKDNHLTAGYWNFDVNNEIYGTHVYVLDGNQHITENTKFGDANDCATGTATDKMAKNMVIVKVNGDLEINPGVTVGPYYNNTYGGPKGFMLYVTGKLINNGTIDNSHGAYAYGQDVYLWKNPDGSYEYVPAVGGAGGAAVCGETRTGIKGENATDRALGGGGSGSSHGLNNNYCSGAGTAATSYSGGSGGGSMYSSHSGGYAGAQYGGAGGNGSYYVSSYRYGGGAGNPGGKGDSNGGSGTGGLLIIFANEYENNSTISATGKNGGGGYVAGGSSGGGSINIFTNQSTNINDLGIVTNIRYKEILGTTNVNGGIAAGSDNKSGAGGTGSIHIGEMRNGQYYDLKEIIDQDKEIYAESFTKHGDSILSIINDNSLVSGNWIFETNGVKYNTHVYVLDGNQHITSNTQFGDANDCASSTSADNMAKNMVIVKVNGDLEINSGVTVGPYYGTYGGPKGFILYVTGKLTNNGTIDNSHGAYAYGQDVYLWKNADDTYEFVPAVGGAGGASTCGNVSGNAGIAGSNRALGGGGAGGAFGYCAATGSKATSYSGGAGGASSYTYNGGAGGANGGAGGNGYYGGGAGNPGGSGNTRGGTGIGGLLVVYSKQYENNGALKATGSAGGGGFVGGGSAGGGSINVFYHELIRQGTNNVSAGGTTGSKYKGGAGGTGTVTYTQIDMNSITSKKSSKIVNKPIVINNPKFNIENNEDNTMLITINYDGNYTYEYSLDFGQTWYVYSEPIEINTNTTIFARTVNNGTVIATSTLTITGYEEGNNSSPSNIIPPVIVEDNSNKEEKSEVSISE